MAGFRFLALAALLHLSSHAVVGGPVQRPDHDRQESNSPLSTLHPPTDFFGHPKQAFQQLLQPLVKMIGDDGVPSVEETLGPVFEGADERHVISPVPTTTTPEIEPVGKRQDVAPPTGLAGEALLLESTIDLLLTDPYAFIGRRRGAPAATTAEGSPVQKRQSSSILNTAVDNIELVVDLLVTDPYAFVGRRRDAPMNKR